MVVIVTSESLAIEDERLKRAAILAGQSFVCLSELETEATPVLPHDAAPAMWDIAITADEPMPTPALRPPAG
jgi:hypothetical protein